MKRILINAEQPNETRIAYLDDNKLVELELESQEKPSTNGNIYVGIISAVKADLESAFIDLGSERHGLLSYRNIPTGRDDEEEREKPPVEPPFDYDPSNFKPGQKVLVQVFRDARGEKGSSLTTGISIPGRFVVLKPNSDIRAVTRSVPDSQRQALRDLGNQLPRIEGVGWIMRTTSVGHTVDEIKSDFHRLLNLWKKIEHTYVNYESNEPALVYSDNTILQRVLRDKLRRDGTTVIVDDARLYRKAQEFASDHMPELLENIELYRGPKPIFDAFRVDAAVRSTYNRAVKLPSGGMVVFDPTEALLSIDVNSARNTSASSLEQTALTTNLEAAEEICRQLILRNVGGLVVVDFIDMATPGFNERVEKLVQSTIESDPGNTTASQISEYGLMEMSRLRRRSSIYDTHFVECSHCSGSRFVPKIETNANDILRTLSYRLHDTTKQENQYICRIPEDVATYLLNKERQYIRDLEVNTRKQVVLIPDPTMSGNALNIKARRVKNLDFESGSNLDEVVSGEQTLTKRRMKKTGPDESQQAQTPLVSPLDSRNSPKKKTQKQKSERGGESKPKAKKKQSKKKGKNKGLFAKLTGIFTGNSNKQKGSKQKPKGRQSKQEHDARRVNRRPQPDAQGRQRRSQPPRGNQRDSQSQQRGRSSGNQTSSRAKPQPRRDGSKQTPNREDQTQAKSNQRRQRRSNRQSDEQPRGNADSASHQQGKSPERDHVERTESKDGEPSATKRMPPSGRSIGNKDQRSRQRSRSQEGPRADSDKRNRRQPGGRPEKVPHVEADDSAESSVTQASAKPSATRHSARKSQRPEDFESKAQTQESTAEASPQETPAEHVDAKESKENNTASSKRQFAANDPRSKVVSDQEPTDSKPGRVESNQDSQEETLRDELTNRSDVPTVVTDSKKHTPQADAQKPEEPVPDAQTADNPVQDQTESEPLRAGNDPRSRH